MGEFPPSSLQPLIQEVFDLLVSRKETISVAETVRLPSHPYRDDFLPGSR